MDRTPNHDKGKKSMRKIECVLVLCKHFLDLYQVSLKDKAKHVETHATKNAFVKANVEINNVLVKKISFAPEVLNSLEVFDFLRILIDIIRHQISGQQLRL